MAILSTGDEVVTLRRLPDRSISVTATAFRLAAQVRLAGGEPVLLGNAGDRVEELSAKIEQGLQEDMLILSGGVSMGKYDLVEGVLKSLGGEFFFDAVAVRPGKPTVVGRVREKLVFGLPGNPVSTMVTFNCLRFRRLMCSVEQRRGPWACWRRRPEKRYMRKPV